MSNPLDPAVAEEMRKRAQAIKDRQAQGGFTKQWSLTGKNAIVQPGQEAIVRLLPRWDYANSMILEGDKRVRNPKYKGGPSYVTAYEHWWEAPDGKTLHAWCPRSRDEQAVCELCRLSVVLIGSTDKADKELGKRLQPREVDLVNAVVGNPRKLNDAGLADIRVMSLSSTVSQQIFDIMTGAPEFGGGDATDPKTGRDFKLVRPQKGGNDRWRVIAGSESTLYTQEQAAAFKGWVNRLTDLEDMLNKETKSPQEIFKMYWGRDPKPGELEGQPETAPEVNPFDDEQPDQAPAAAEPESPDDDFMPPPQTAPQPAKAATASRPPLPLKGRPAAVFVRGRR